MVVDVTAHDSSRKLFCPEYRRHSAEPRGAPQLAAVSILNRVCENIAILAFPMMSRPTSKICLSAVSFPVKNTEVYLHQ